jgi:hydrogenase/urease accessory protein HupE
MILAHLFLIATAPLAFGLHEDSVSSSQVAIGTDAITIELRFQALSMEEVVPLDRDGDGRIQSEEILAESSAMGEYLLQHYSLRLGSEQLGSELVLAGVVESITLDPKTEGFDIDLQWLAARMVFQRSTDAPDLWINVALFGETSPGHKDFAELAGTDSADHSPTRMWIFSRSNPQWLVRLPVKVEIEAPAPATAELAPDSTRQEHSWAPILPWINLGFRHVLGGLDHLCFVFALLLAAGSMRSLAGSVTAFTIAHSITLGAVALGWFAVSPALAEPLIAASIVFVGVANLWKGCPRRVWPEALGFGLLHGLGFASLLGDALGTTQTRLLPLLGFNLGIELGQLLAALAVILTFSLLARMRSPRRGQAPSEAPPAGALASPRMAQIGSIGITCAGIFWLASRLLG